MTTIRTSDIADRLGGPIADFVEELVDERGFAGVHVTVADAERTLLAANHGWRDREADQPMTDDTIMRIYSMTKPVIATALMTLFDDRRFDLDDPLAAYLPALRDVKVLVDGRLVEPDRPIRIRDALTHTCGMTNELQATPVAALYRDAGIHADPTRSLATLIDVLSDLPLAYQPGQRWHYGMGLDLAAALIEVLADQPLGDFLRTRLFDPLGMPDTAFGVPEPDRARLAAMYGGPDLLAKGQSTQALIDAWTSGDNRRRDVNATYPIDATATFARGGIGLFSTARDYTRFARMLLNQGELDGTRIIAADTSRLMHRNHLPNTLLPFHHGGVPVAGYGFGLGSSVLTDVAAAGGIGSKGQHGWSGAAATYFWVDPQLQLTVVLMAQSMMRMDTCDDDLNTIIRHHLRHHPV
jgi:CubicO group peptidase (beta-lactamase class C family)